MYRVDDIPNYDNLFIRDGRRVFVVNKHTGEILHNLSVLEYCDFWVNDYTTNKDMQKFYRRGLFSPKGNPDTAQNIKELRKLCSDTTRHRKGDTGYLLDFLMADACNKTESKLFLHLTKNIIVWNYAVVNYSDLPDVTGVKTSKQLKTIWQNIQEKGLMQVLNENFKVEDGYCILVKVHPKVYWEGRYTAWIAKCKADYEYEDAITVSDSS